MEHKNILKKIPPPLPKWNEDDERHHALGGVTNVKTPLMPDGQWVKYLPDGEKQFNPFFDSFNCTGFTYADILEILWFFVFGVRRNFSDRGVGIVAGTKPPGNDPYVVAQAGKDNGLIDEELLPFNDSIKTVEEFYSPNPLPQELIKKGKEFLSEVTPNYAQVGRDNESGKIGLTYSPLETAVVAWYRDSEGYFYFPDGLPSNHDSKRVGYKEGVYWLFYDHYPEEDENVIKSHMQEFGVTRSVATYLKKVRWDSKFERKSLQYALNPGTKEVKNALIEVIKSFISFFQNLLIQKKTTNSC